jgi:biopolymer transport protein ExbB
MRLKSLGVLSLLAAMLVSIGAAIVSSREAMAQAPKAETAPAAATEVKPVPSEVKPAPPPAGPTTEALENPYGLEALWRQGDFVARGTLIILMIMSIGSWYIGIVKVIEQRRMLKDAEEADEKFWHAKSVQEGVATLKEDSAFRFVAEKSHLAAEHHGTMQTKQLDLNTWVGMALQRAIDVVSNRLQGGLAFLATVGSTAPFVGLFGTVWGIYHALTAIGIAGQASIDKVAGPVGEALIMTALGLAVAVPAVLGYNWLVRRNRVAMELIRHFGGGVHMSLLGRGGRTREGAQP